MTKLYTQILWNLNNYCKAECSYCPSQLRGGVEPKHISEYIAKAKMMISHYNNMDRAINWTFNGGEPLDMFDFAEFLKLCKTSEGTIDLTTNGGRLWLDWWAIEPYIDTLHLTYHYWQNPNLIKFIIQVFQKNNKSIEVIVPVRPDFFEEDFQRSLDVQSEFNLVVSKYVLYNNANSSAGMFPYTDTQLRLIKGEELVEAKQHFEETTFKERVVEVLHVSPSFTGKLCNVGIEKLHISHEGWVSGSSCNNTHLGNIWHENFQLPNGPSKCKMIACTDSLDQQITKFDIS